MPTQVPLRARAVLAAQARAGQPVRRSALVRLAAGDFNAMGHLGNDHYARSLELGRLQVFGPLGDGSGYPFVLVHVSVDYRREILRGAPDPVLETSVVRIGRSSVELGHHLLVGDRIAAEARSVCAAFDLVRRATRPLTDMERYYLEDLECA